LNGRKQGLQPRTVLRVEFAQSAERFVDHGHRSFHPHRHARSMGAGYASAQDHDLAGCDSSHAAEENAASPLFFL
jgi:hypothetical protein